MMSHAIVIPLIEPDFDCVFRPIAQLLCNDKCDVYLELRLCWNVRATFFFSYLIDLELLIASLAMVFKLFNFSYDRLIESQAIELFFAFQQN